MFEADLKYFDVFDGKTGETRLKHCRQFVQFFQMSVPDFTPHAGFYIGNGNRADLSYSHTTLDQKTYDTSMTYSSFNR